MCLRRLSLWWVTRRENISLHDLTDKKYNISIFLSSIYYIYWYTTDTITIIPTMMPKMEKTHILFHILLIFLMMASVCPLTLRTHAPNSSPPAPSHNYFFSKDHPNIASDDDHWYYCDYKCLTLEKLNPGKDFVVIGFSAMLKEKFMACYVKDRTSYTLWSKVTTNDWYEKYCGEDYKDWLAEGSWNIDGIWGVGIGTPLTDNDQRNMYKKWGYWNEADDWFNKICHYFCNIVGKTRILLDLSEIFLFFRSFFCCLTFIIITFIYLSFGAIF